MIDLSNWDSYSDESDYNNTDTNLVKDEPSNSTNQISEEIKLSSKINENNVYYFNNLDISKSKSILQ